MLMHQNGDVCFCVFTFSYCRNYSASVQFEFAFHVRACKRFRWPADMPVYSLLSFFFTVIIQLTLAISIFCLQISDRTTILHQNQKELNEGAAQVMKF